MRALGVNYTSNMSHLVAQVRAEMSNLCECLQGNSCQRCSAAGLEIPVGSDLAKVLLDTVSKLKELTKEVSFLQKRLHVQSVRQQKAEVANIESSECDGRNSVSRSSSRIKHAKNRSNKAKYKKARVDKLNSKSQFEISSEEEMRVRAVERCEFKHSTLGNSQKQSKLNLDESISSAEESSNCGSSESSESDVIPQKQKRRKVKSGAVVKRRPVVKTELWPHTIANEEDGENITIEDISLTKFLSCYTNIMINCVKSTEVEGRTGLLHAVSTVLEYLPWSEARAFHNITMFKIEQDKLKWSSDFLALANQFLDKKVRLSLRMNNYSDDNSNFSTSDRSDGEAQQNSNFRHKSHLNLSKSNFLYYALCNQWNYGECSYGSDCKRWHACRLCAAEGKLGEPHKASFHDCSTTRNRECEQRV